MVNSWSLLYDEIYGDDEMSPCKIGHTHDDDVVITTVGSGNTASADTFRIDAPPLESVSIDTSGLDVDLFASMDGVEYQVPPYVEPVTISTNMDHITFTDAPTPGIEKDCTRKYKEDESIKALQDYISTTYGGHYTSDQNNVQTLDLIESVGDAESFCRSNAIKYLSRYDKKGQAKRDILKALHYTLLLYHFSGQLNETPTRGYETF